MTLLRDNRAETGREMDRECCSSKRCSWSFAGSCWRTLQHLGLANSNAGICQCMESRRTTNRARMARVIPRMARSGLRMMIAWVGLEDLVNF